MSFRPNDFILAGWSEFAAGLKVRGATIVDQPTVLEDQDRRAAFMTVRFFQTFRISTIFYGWTEHAYVDFLTVVLQDGPKGDVSDVAQMAHVQAVVPVKIKDSKLLEFDAGGRRGRGYVAPAVHWRYHFDRKELEVMP